MDIKTSQKPRVKLDLDREDFTDSFRTLYEKQSIITQEETFKTAASNYYIRNISDSNISNYFKTVKESIRKTVTEFKGNNVINLNIIITSEFETPLAFDIVEGHFNHKSKTLTSMNNFDNTYENIQEEFEAWIDEYQDRGSGFVFHQIITTNMRLSKFLSM